MSYKNQLLAICCLILVFTNISSQPKEQTNRQSTSIATLAGGCFWCMEPPFDKLDGVLSTTSGYLGGHKVNPTYRDVSSGTSGHIEAVQIEFDPKKINFTKLLEVYWKNVDPTRSDGQFCDKGEQYRPAIFYHDKLQRTIAISQKNKLSQNKNFPESIKVEILKATKFYPAEDYHQDYYLKNPVRYKFYRYKCGRDQRLKELWGNKNT